MADLLACIVDVLEKQQHAGVSASSPIEILIQNLPVPVLASRHALGSGPV
jgi:hypothetical protein